MLGCQLLSPPSVSTSHGPFSHPPRFFPSTQVSFDTVAPSDSRSSPFPLAVFRQSARFANQTLSILATCPTHMSHSTIPCVTVLYRPPPLTVLSIVFCRSVLLHTTSSTSYSLTLGSSSIVILASPFSRPYVRVCRTHTTNTFLLISSLILVS